MAEIWILRLGHRPERDKRITTHVALTARAFGAKGIFVSTKDTGLEESVQDVVERFGGDFQIKSGVQWHKLLKDFADRGKIVHLTMYGLPVDEMVPRIPDPQTSSSWWGPRRCPRRSTRQRTTISRSGISPTRRWRPWPYSSTGWGTERHWASRSSQAGRSR